MAYQSIPPGPSHKTTLAATSDTITVSGINGNVGGVYLVDIQLTINSAAPSFEFKPNSQNSNLLALTGDFLNGSVNRTDWVVGRLGSNPWTFASGDVLSAQGRLNAKTGSRRTLVIDSFMDLATNTRLAFMGVWTETTTNMTTFQVVGSQADAFAIGSYVRLTPLFITT